MVTVYVIEGTEISMITKWCERGVDNQSGRVLFP